MIRLLTAALNWLLRPPAHARCRWANETHLGLGEDDDG